ncbi:MAG: SH3 domain-containing protein, partial [bacterium]|nr:SH3 domain-containing protein [bacterium]
MLSGKKFFAIIVVFVYVVSLGSATAFSPQPGSSDDPLVTVSYVTQAVQPMLVRITNIEALNLTQLQQLVSQLNAKVSDLESRIATLEKPTGTTVVYGYINGSVVNVRSGPGTSFAIVMSLTNNTKVEVLEKGSWHKIRHSGKVGYVLGSLL